MLIGIAICISDSVRRAGDCAARYGGEEFAVLLPALSAAEALVVAETIRLKVQQWSDHTTVSIGVASLTPDVSHGMVRTGRSRRQGALRGQGRRPQPVRGGHGAAAFAGGLGDAIELEFEDPGSRLRWQRRNDGMRRALPSLLQILLHLGAQAVAQIGARHAEGDVGAQEARLGAAIMPLALEFDAVEIFASWPARSSRR